MRIPSSPGRLLFLAAVLVGMTLPASAAPSDPSTTAAPELACDIWDWTPPAKDLALFESWLADLKRLGFNRVELSVPWKLLEPAPGEYDLTWLRERAALCRKHGLGMRLRINSHYRRAVPSWYPGEFWRDADGTKVFSGVPSICDEQFWSHYGPLCTLIARELRGQDVLYNAFIGPHAELKYANWWSFDPATLYVWRDSIRQPRPPWLSRVVGQECELPATPRVPPPTSGLPDLSPDSRAFIAFREWTWRRAVERFVRAVREGDPAARISSPLGESYRRESAPMSNLDYWGCSRGSDQVVHSYDFFLHPGRTPLWHVAATIASFQGITGKPVVFEFDSPETMASHGYTDTILQEVARTTLRAGAGLKFANFSYYDRLPGSWPILSAAPRLAAEETGSPSRSPAPPRDTVLLFMSKWANYCYREPTEWLHEAQFGWWKLLHDSGVPTRIICEDNLAEDLSAYRALILAFSPLDLLPEEDRRCLERLQIPMILDHATHPTHRPEKAFCVPTAAGNLGLPASLPFPLLSLTEAELSARPFPPVTESAEGRVPRVVLGFPVGYGYFHAEEGTTWREMARALLEGLEKP